MNTQAVQQKDTVTIVFDNSRATTCYCESCGQTLRDSISHLLHEIGGPIFIFNENDDDGIGLVLSPEYPALWMTWAFLSENLHLPYREMIGALVSLGHAYLGPEADLPLLSSQQVSEIRAHLYKQFRLNHPLLSLYFLTYEN